MKYSNVSSRYVLATGQAILPAGALTLGVVMLIASMAAWGQDDTVQQRRQELRNMVRQQGTSGVAPASYSKPVNVATASTAANNAADSVANKPAANAAEPPANSVNMRHLSAQERTELRRQLAKDLRAQRVSGNTAQQ